MKKLILLLFVFVLSLTIAVQIFAAEDDNMSESAAISDGRVSTPSDNPLVGTKKSDAVDLSEPARVPPQNNPFLNSFSRVASAESIIHKGKTILLYAEFSDQNEAIESLYYLFPKTMSSLDQSLVSKMSEGNWETYRGAYKEHFNRSLTEAEIEEYFCFERFFDIFENKYKNEDISYELAAQNT